MQKFFRSCPEAEVSTNTKQNPPQPFIEYPEDLRKFLFRCFAKPEGSVSRPITARKFSIRFLGMTVHLGSFRSAYGGMKPPEAMKSRPPIAVTVSRSRLMKRR